MQFQKQTVTQFDELVDNQGKLEQSQRQSRDNEATKLELQKQLAGLIASNEESKNRQAEAKDLTPEQYLEQLGEEKDLQKLQHFCQLVYAKYMQLMSQQFLEQLSKGGPNAQNTMPGFPMVPPQMQQMPQS